MNDNSTNVKYKRQIFQRQMSHVKVIRQILRKIRQICSINVIIKRLISNSNLISALHFNFLGMSNI